MCSCGPCEFEIHKRHFRCAHAACSPTGSTVASGAVVFAAAEGVGCAGMMFSPTAAMSWSARKSVWPGGQQVHVQYNFPRHVSTANEVEAANIAHVCPANKHRKIEGRNKSLPVRCCSRRGFTAAKDAEEDATENQSQSNKTSAVCKQRRQVNKKLGFQPTHTRNTRGRGHRRSSVKHATTQNR